MRNLYKITQYQLEAAKRHTFRSGYQYQILLIVQGVCRMCGDNQSRQCRTADMILLKPEQTQTLEACESTAPCSLVCVSVSRETLAALSDDTCRLEEKFEFAPYRTNIIHAEITSFMLIRNILTKLAALKEETGTFGTELYQKSLFTTFLVHFLRTCVQSDQIHELHQKKTLIIDDVFEYISQHLTEDLSLKTLEEVFFISGEHISREFKKNTGITLHTYITRSRIDLSRQYLLQGMSVRDVCQLCGFSSYNHFFKIFKKECGMTPMAYYRKVRDTYSPAGGVPHAGSAIQR